MKFMRQTTYFVVSRCHFPHHSDELAQCGHWSAQKPCGTCFMHVTVCFLFRSVSLCLPLMWGGSWTGEWKCADDEHCVMVFCKTIECTWNKKQIL